MATLGIGAGLLVVGLALALALGASTLLGIAHLLVGGEAGDPPSR